MAEEMPGGEPGGAGGEFEELVEPLRGELRAHCYRMLGSLHDAEDALQETLLRAWRGMDRFERRSSVRTWLYSIATNTCLTQISRRSSLRVLPFDYGPSVDGHEPPGAPVEESVWIEPYPDRQLGLGEGASAPEAAYEQREGIELAFVAALQHLAPSQRAVLILREVLGYSAAEAAEMLETSVASVNSALQRARAAVEERVPAQSQQKALQALGDEGLRQLVERWVAAWETNDVPAFAALLTEDATFSMPPLATWYGGREAVLEWASRYSMSGAWRWKAVQTSANGQPALAFYAWDEQAGAFLPFALNVLALRDGLVSSVTAFIVRATGAEDEAEYVRFPERPMDARQLGGVYEAFGLPGRLEGE